MNKGNLSRLLKTIASLAIILGVIHTSATPFVSKQFSMLQGGNLQVFIYMFVMTGLAMIYLGLNLLSQSKLLKLNQSLNGKGVLSSILFLLIYGVYALFCMSENPFAWICFVTSLGGLLTFILLTRANLLTYKS